MHRVILLAATVCTVVRCSGTTSDTTSDATENSAMAEIGLADDTFKRILKKHGDDVDPSKMSKAEQTVLWVYHAYGILGNGGFQYLFEGDFPGDPEFLLTRQAFKTIGASDASAAFEKAFAVFPNSTPPADIERRLEMWQAKYNLMDSLKDGSSPDMMFFESMDGVMEKLNAYFLAYGSEFMSLPR